MPTLNARTAAAKVYLLTLIIVGMLVSILPQLALAIALLALQLYTTYKPPAPKMNLALTVGTLILTPLTLVTLLGSSLAALPIIPAVYLLNQNLRENAPTHPAKNTKTTRTPTQTLTVMTITLTTALVASLMLLNETLMLASTTLLVYLAAILVYSYHKIPTAPIKENKTWRRIVVGTTENTPITLSTKTKLPLNITLSATQPWIHLNPENIILATQTEAQITITYTPPLAGPTTLQIQAAAIDPWGLIQINQTVEPVDLHIIPRAKYAQWLAKKYLEQNRSGAALNSSASPMAVKSARTGVEFYGSRLYQSGDRLKDVDWKHTLMLDELIVKEFAGAQGTPTVIAAYLTAKDEQDADKLVYKVVMAALTAATESLPSGLACFNQKEVIAVSAPTNPRETLKVALQITEKTTITPQPTKIMQPPQIQKLKRTIKALNQAETKQAKGFTEILQFEYEAIQATAKRHPASEALKKCVEKTPSPATITVASTGSGDVEALAVTLEKLKERGYNIVTL
jgi:uncharacterized protein (DUF58 family)